MFNHLENKNTIYTLRRDNEFNTDERESFCDTHKVDMNIFCDASVMQVNDAYISVPGAIYMENNILVDIQSDILFPSTNNEGEIYAIYLAYLLALKTLRENPYTYDRINIYSDSKISVMGLREWIYSWYNNSYSSLPVLTSSSGKEVSNQNIFKHIVNVIVEAKIPINLYHVKGHVNLKNQSSLDNARNVFKASNGLSVHPRVISELAIGNDKVDVLTKEIIMNNIPSSLMDMIYKHKCEETKTTPMHIEICEDTLYKYKNLVKGM